MVLSQDLKPGDVFDDVELGPVEVVEHPRVLGDRVFVEVMKENYGSMDCILPIDQPMQVGV